MGSAVEKMGATGETLRDGAFKDAIFSSEELELAQLFKAFGLDWTPRPGMYVLDQSELIECPSPFQDRVFFILDLKHFLRRSGTIESLKDRVCWLPTWEQARQILSDLGVPAAQIALRLVDSRALIEGTERLELYRMIEERITGEELF
ncbi:MAG: hypothetical protein Aurels2KO_12490 [Aureliella sp.]